MIALSPLSIEETNIRSGMFSDTGGGISREKRSYTLQPHAAIGLLQLTPKRVDWCRTLLIARFSGWYLQAAFV